MSADVFDLDGDGDVTEPTPVDLEGTVRFWDAPAIDTGAGSAPIVDIGAAEFRGAVCQPDLGFQGPGTLTVHVCGADLTTAQSAAVLQIAHAPPNSIVLLFAGPSANPTPVPGTAGILVPIPVLPPTPLLLPVDALGNLSLPITGGDQATITIALQGIAQNGTTVEFSNAIEATLGI